MAKTNADKVFFFSYWCGPRHGNLVDLNGAIHAYTSMLTLAATGLTPGSNYYIYLYDNAGTPTLEASTTGITVDTKGRANKTGDATRRLMGMANVITGPAWGDKVSADAPDAILGTTAVAVAADVTSITTSGCRQGCELPANAGREHRRLDDRDHRHGADVQPGRRQFLQPRPLGRGEILWSADK